MRATSCGVGRGVANIRGTAYTAVYDHRSRLPRLAASRRAMVHRPSLVHIVWLTAPDVSDVGDAPPRPGAAPLLDLAAGPRVCSRSVV